VLTCAIDTYTIAHDYLKIRKSRFVPHDLFVPLALVDGVDLVARDVHLAVTKHHLRQVCVMLPEHGSTPNTILVPDN
jgi:hypothetical protein